MNNDFETHDRGTAEEIRLARKLANEIECCIMQGGVMPVQIRSVYKELRAFYEKQVENEAYKDMEVFDKPLQNNLFGLELWQ
jgi:hypothetical protein